MKMQGIITTLTILTILLIYTILNDIIGIVLANIISISLGLPVWVGLEKIVKIKKSERAHQ
jgi:hypothetical protein